MKKNIFIILVLPIFFQISVYSKEFDEEAFFNQYFWREIISLSPPDRPKIGLVLSGGCARGLAHIGVIKVLQEEEIPIDIITGTSVGALAGALTCSGIPVEKLEKMATEIGWTDLTNVSATSVMGLVLSDRLLSTQKMEDYIAENIGNKQFHELNIPFACVATDLRTGEKIIFREGQVSQAVRASANIPGLFTPVEYRHRLLVDGGLVNNVPVDLAKSMGADIIITVNLESDFTKTNINNVMLVFNQAIAIQSSLLSREQLKLSDIVITPQTKDVAFYELWRSKECIEAGIVACRKSIPEIKQKLIGQTYKWILKKRKK